VRRERIEQAEERSRNFLRKARDYREREQKDGALVMYGCKESGALRRASLDLTRSLADMRRP